MPITAYSGLPGHGKSHSVVEHVILPALKAHRCVVTNVALKWDKVREAFPGCDLRPFDIDAVKAHPSSIGDAAPPGCVLVIDEAWKLWPAGQTAKDVPEPFKAILAEHRHRVDALDQSMQVVIVTQDLGQIGKFARDLVEETFRTCKLTSLGSSKRYRVDVYNGPVAGANPPASKRVRQLFGKYRAEVWQWYQSHTMSESGDSGANEQKVDGRGVIWRSPALWIGATAIVLCLGYGIYAVTAFFGKDRPAKVVADPESKKNASLDLRGGFSQPRPVQATWRITMEVTGGARDIVALEDGRRYVILNLRDYCQRDVSGFLICEFEGQRISNQIQYLPDAPASSPVLSVFPAPAAPVEDQS